MGKRIYDHEVIIDVPERNSFASDLLVQSETGSVLNRFAKTHTVFGPEVVSKFGQTLRSIAVIGSRRPGLNAALCRVGPEVISAFRDERKATDQQSSES